jgi:predicted MFS family arabinose efflux permease
VRSPLPALGALATAAFITVLTEALPAGVLPGMSEGLGVSESAAGQTVTAYALGTALATIPLTAATAHWPRKRLLLTGIAGFAVANTVTAVADDYLLTMAARVVAGLAAGVVWVLLAGYARLLAPPGRQGPSIAFVMAGIPAALSLGVPAGTFLGGLAGWRTPFAVMTGLAVVLLVWIAALVPDQPGSRQAHVPVARVFAMPGVGAVLAVTLLFVLAHTILYTYLAPVLAGVRLDVALLVFGVTSLAGTWLVGANLDRRLRALTVASLLLFAVAMAVIATPGGGQLVTYVAVGLWGLGWGGVPTLMQTAVAEAGSAAADMAQAALVTLWNVAMAGGSVLGGLVLSTLGPAAFPWLALVLAVPTLAIVVGARVNAFPALATRVATRG